MNEFNLNDFLESVQAYFDNDTITWETTLQELGLAVDDFLMFMENKFGLTETEYNMLRPKFMDNHTMYELFERLRG